MQSPTLAFYQFVDLLIFEADAPRTQGFGFELVKLHDNEWALIQCGSNFTCETGSGYAMTELECLVIVRATATSKVVLACAEFEIITGDKPPVPILRKCGLDQFEDPRFPRLVMKLQSLQLTVQWRGGHSIAVTHSRAPIDSPTKKDLLMVGIKTGMLAKVKRK